MTSRKWITRQALESVRALGKVIDQLTMQEVMECLDFEASTQRRRSVIDRLIKRAISLTATALQEKYRG